MARPGRGKVIQIDKTSSHQGAYGLLEGLVARDAQTVNNCRFAYGLVFMRWDTYYIIMYMYCITLYMYM